MTRSGTVAIHQPNFFPWLGFFHKLAHADTFVLLDNVQFPKKGGTWTNRVQLLVGGKRAWVTAPVARSYRGVRPIREICLSGTADWRTRLVSTIRANYGRAPYFGEVFELIESLVTEPTDRLAHYNEGAIRTLAAAIGLDRARLIPGSQLGVPGQSTELLVEIVKSVGGRAYLSGSGASDYQDDNAFPGAGIELIHQGFEHPIYPQPGHTWTPGLSIVDALMNCGLRGTRSLLLDGSASP